MLSYTESKKVATLLHSFTMTSYNPVFHINFLSIFLTMNIE